MKRGSFPPLHVALQRNAKLERGLGGEVHRLRSEERSAWCAHAIRVRKKTTAYSGFTVLCSGYPRDFRIESFNEMISGDPCPVVIHSCSNMRTRRSIAR